VRGVAYQRRNLAQDGGAASSGADIAVSSAPESSSLSLLAAKTLIAGACAPGMACCAARRLASIFLNSSVRARWHLVLFADGWISLAGRHALCMALGPLAPGGPGEPGLVTLLALALSAASRRFVTACGGSVDVETNARTPRFCCARLRHAARTPACTSIFLSSATTAAAAHGMWRGGTRRASLCLSSLGTALNRQAAAASPVRRHAHICAQSLKRAVAARRREQSVGRSFAVTHLGGAGG